MPVYPCARCGGPVDPTTDMFCKACSDKQPYECSRCNKRMSSNEVFQLEKLKTKRPLLCQSCGEAGEVVKCKICKLSLVRATGKTVSPNPGAPVYHSACLEKQLRTVAWIQRMAPILLLVGLALGWLVGQNIAVGNTTLSLVCCLVTGVAFCFGTYSVALFVTPK